MGATLLCCLHADACLYALKLPTGMRKPRGGRRHTEMNLVFINNLLNLQPTHAKCALEKTLFYQGRDNMKLRTMFWTAAMLIVVFFASGCGSGGGSDSPAAVDSITINSISPSTVISGTSTTFTVSVSYSLQTKNSGIIDYGFQAGSGGYALENNSQIVSKGMGTASFAVTKTLTQTNTVFVLLSENPHPTSTHWSPLVYTQQTITVN